MASIQAVIQSSNNQKHSAQRAVCSFLKVRQGHSLRVDGRSPTQLKSMTCSCCTQLLLTTSNAGFTMFAAFEIVAHLLGAYCRRALGVFKYLKCDGSHIKPKHKTITNQCYSIIIFVKDN